MGIGRFYRWLSERYPLINEKITQAALPEFDNLYLDMNGILHNCSHGNSGGCLHDEEEAMWVSVFAALDSIISTINPKKLLVLAADGVAPRAKMNQQRTRRYRAAKDAAEAAEKKEAYEIAKQHLQRQAGVAFQGGGKANKKKKGLFDSNCISPGTEFMAKFFKHLRFFCEKKLNEDSRWKDLKVILSGPDVPGEGEHKIMNFLRCSKTDPKTDRNTRHCLYGLDADLIMLALASHEPHFCLLREEVFFGRSVSRRPEDCLLTKGENLQLLHISLLREYLFMEFPCPSPPPSARRLLSSSSPSSSSHSPSGPGGRFHPSNVQQVMNGNSTSSTSTTTRSSRTQGGGGGGGGRKEVKSGEEEEEFSSALQNGDEERRHLATGREGKEDPNSSVNLYRKSICGSDSDSCPYEWKPSLLYPRERERMIDDFVLFCFMVGNDFLPHPKATDIADGGLNALMNCYKQYLRNYYTLADNAASPRGPWLSFDCGRIDFCNFFLFLSLFVDTVEVELLEDLAGDSDWLQSKQSSHREAYMEAIDENLDSCQRYRYTFYYTKMKINPNTQDGSQELDRLARKYLEGLQWVLYYYYRGPCHSGWEWYYPYHYSPFLIDVLQCSFFTEDVETLSDLRKKRISFPPSKPFSPFLQLLSILPPRSAALLPRCLHRLVAVPPPELAAFFPDDFEVDMEGCKVSWGGVALLPFIDENLLIRAAEPLFSRLTKEEIQRNTRGKVVLLYRDPQRHIKFLRSLARSSSSLGHLFTAAPTREEEEDLDSLRRRSFLYFPPDQGQESSIRQQKGGETRSPTSSRLGLYPGTNTRMVDRSRKTVSSLPSAFPDLLHSFVHEEVIEVLPPVVVQRRLRSLRRLNEKERRADEEEEKKNREREKIHHENLGRSLSMCTSNRDSGRGYRQRGGMEREREREEEEEERGSSGIFDLEEIDACRGSENVGEDHAFPNFVLEGTVKRLDEFPTFDRVKFTWEYFTGVQVFNTASKKTSISIKVTPPYASSSPSQKDSSSSSPLLFSYSTDSPSRLSSSHAQQEGRHPSSSSTMMIDSSRTFYRRKDSQGTIPQGVGGRASPSHSKLTSIEAFSAERDFLAYLDSPLVYYDFPFLRLAKP
ncbi:xrn 5 -3 exonuclease n-terminus protein, partial [Cystoisospora suis]